MELSTKHILGRPPFDQEEVANYIERMNDKGFDFHIDKLINSTEYQELFGANTVPYMKAWDSGCGLRTTSFTFSATLEESFASSDNAIHKRITKPESKSGNSKLIKKLMNKESTV